MLTNSYEQTYREVQKLAPIIEKLYPRTEGKRTADIYVLINIFNGKFYLGSSDEAFSRVKDGHHRYLKRGDHDNSYLQKSYSKWLKNTGKNPFKAFRIAIVDLENQYLAEQIALDKFFDGAKQCYNLVPTAGGGCPISRWKKVSQICMDTGEILAVHPSLIEAERVTDIYYVNISMCCSGTIHSAGGFCWEYAVDDTECFLPEDFSIIKAKAKCAVKCKKVSQICMDTGEILAVHPSLIEAERVTNIDNVNISTCCLGKRNSAGGFHWKFVADDAKCFLPEDLSKIKAKLFVNFKKVSQICIKTGKVLAVHPSLIEAERVTDVRNSNISASCLGKLRSTGGFYWEYTANDAVCFLPDDLSIIKAKPNFKRVSQICMDTGEVFAFHRSTSEAGRVTDVGQSRISACCLGKIRSAGGFYWKFAADDVECFLPGDLSIINAKSIFSSCPKKVSQICLETRNTIKVFESMSVAARELNLNTAHITSCCKGKLKSHGGYYWQYA